MPNAPNYIGNKVDDAACARLRGDARGNKNNRRNYLAPWLK